MKIRYAHTGSNILKSSPQAYKIYEIFPREACFDADQNLPQRFIITTTLSVKK